MVEVGCGPGHVTAYLAEAGADAFGIDLSPGMVEEARRRFPDGNYEVGDLRRLMRPTYGAGWTAVLAWYSLIHLAASELPDALAALARPLLPGGWLVVGLHTGASIRHLDEWFDAPVDLDFVLHDLAEVVRLVEDAGMTDVEWYHRGAIPSPWRDQRAALRRRPQARLMRVLFSSTSGYGHVIPMLPLAHAFREAGHDVLWATTEQAMPLVAASGIEAVASGASGAEEAALRAAVRTQGGAAGRPRPSARSCSRACSERR